MSSPWALAGGYEVLSPEQVVRTRVVEAVGRPVEIRIDRNRSAGEWTLICGDPIEPSGSAFEIGSSDLAGSEFGAHFCGLLRATGGDTDLIEFDIGGNDMPAAGWVEEHGLPPTLLSD
jgi:hypothetical protein